MAVDWGECICDILIQSEPFVPQFVLLLLSMVDRRAEYFEFYELENRSHEFEKPHNKFQTKLPE